MMKFATFSRVELKAGLAAVLIVAMTPSSAFPERFTGLNDYVIKAPNQGDTNTCLFVASTGAMEILLNKHLNHRNPKINGATDISERYAISAPWSKRPSSWLESAVLKFDSGEAVLQKDMPYTAFTATGDINYSVWNFPANFYTAPRISVPKIDTELLFQVGDRYSRNVLNETHLQRLKQTLLQKHSPILLNNNDTEYWHVVVVVGFDDDLKGHCYELDEQVCEGKKGALYIRDSNGYGLEQRSYEWFYKRANAAAVVTLAD